MSAPTEEEIRAALTESLPGNDFDVPIEFLEAMGPINDSDMARVRIGWDPGFHPHNRVGPRGGTHPGTLWADLRSTEAEELHGAMATVWRAAGQAYVDVVREGMIAVALAFAEAHPDVPRGHWKRREERVI